jgi:hypothetical protein
LISTIKCVGFDANTEIAPPAPAGTIAAFDTTRPSNEFSVDTVGCASPAGHTDRYASGPGGTTVMFSEYAFAVAGIPHPPLGTEIVRAPDNAGGPNMPVNPVPAYSNRVSTNRHGVIATRGRGPLNAAPRSAPAALEALLPPPGAQ